MAALASPAPYEGAHADQSRQSARWLGACLADVAMTSVGFARLLGGLALLPLSGAGVTEMNKPRRALPAAEHLPQRLQAEVKARTTDHAATMSNFMQAVVLLDRARIESLARSAAEEEVITAGASPMSESSRALLPHDFFTEQIALSAIARQLATAAQTQDDQALSNRFAALTSTCVGCHSSYLHGRPGS